MSDGTFNIVKMLWERKWDTFIVLIFVVLSAVAEPIANRSNTRDVVREEVAPIVESIQALEAFNVVQLEKEMQNLTDEAVVAFDTKILTVEDLQPLTQNGLAVRNGLRVPEIRAILAAMDLQRVLEFEQFFEGL